MSSTAGHEGQLVSRSRLLSVLSQGTASIFWPPLPSQGRACLFVLPNNELVDISITCVGSLQHAATVESAFGTAPQTLPRDAVLQAALTPFGLKDSQQNLWIGLQDSLVDWNTVSDLLQGRPENDNYGLPDPASIGVEYQAPQCLLRIARTVAKVVMVNTKTFTIRLPEFAPIDYVHRAACGAADVVAAGFALCNNQSEVLFSPIDSDIEGREWLGCDGLRLTALAREPSECDVLVTAEGQTRHVKFPTDATLSITRDVAIEILQLDGFPSDWVLWSTQASALNDPELAQDPSIWAQIYPPPNDEDGGEDGGEDELLIDHIQEEEEEGLALRLTQNVQPAPDLELAVRVRDSRNESGGGTPIGSFPPDCTLARARDLACAFAGVQPSSPLRWQLYIGPREAPQDDESEWSALCPHEDLDDDDLLSNEVDLDDFNECGGATLLLVPLRVEEANDADPSDPQRDEHENAVAGEASAVDTGEREAVAPGATDAGPSSDASVSDNREAPLPETAVVSCEQTSSGDPDSNCDTPASNNTVSRSAMSEESWLEVVRVDESSPEAIPRPESEELPCDEGEPATTNSNPSEEAVGGDAQMEAIEPISQPYSDETDL